MKELVEKFLKAFDGYEHAYGQHGGFIEKENGKMEGRAQTIMNHIPDEVVEKHLLGNGDGVGIIPLKDDDKVMFGAIDIDIIGVNPLKHSIKEIEDKLNSLGLPLIPCSTKSNGIHLYCFSKEPISAAIMIKRLKEWAAMIGYGTAEIFPKQSYRVNSQDIGNWINLPYYNMKDSKRKAFNKGKFLSIEEFFDLVEVMRISSDEINNFKTEDLDEEYNDAPPCLQFLFKIGIEEGSRNNGIYNFAVYYKMKNPDSWQDRMTEVNQITHPPLTIRELETIIKSVNKKDFFYKCKEYPICQYCNKNECYKRKYGIGSSAELEINFDNITKYISGEEVIWFAEYQGNRIKLNTEELLNQTMLQKRMVEKTNQIFQPVKASKWATKVNDLLKNCTTVYEPEQASRKGQFFELLDSFLTEGVSGDSKDDLLKYNTYVDENNLVYFRSFNLFSYLKNKRFKYTENEIWIWIKEKGAKNQKIRVAKKPINVWSVPAPETYQFENNDEERI